MYNITETYEKKVVKEINRDGDILVYGPASEYIFEEAIKREIPIYQYDSYTMNRNKLLKKQKMAVGQ